jgi:hypothetical protein
LAERVESQPINALFATASRRQMLNGETRGSSGAILLLSYAVIGGNTALSISLLERRNANDFFVCNLLPWTT